MDSTTVSVCRPIEPVEPRIETRFIATNLSFYFCRAQKFSAFPV
jgi:hypothetical protein